jgi:hypothetical protein
MAAVYVNNLVVNAGTDFTQTFTLEATETNSVLDLSNYSVAAKMRKWSGSTSAVSFSSSIISPSTSGKISIGLTSGETSQLKPGRYVYDVVITDSVQVKSRVIEGMVLVREGVTR